VDEAHCISQWGTTSDPSIASSDGSGSLLPGVSLHALYRDGDRARSARHAARSWRSITVELVGSFDRPNLLYRALPTGTLKRQLQEILDRHRGEAGIIYCTSRREVDALAAWLSGIGVPALPYHAGLAERERSATRTRS
jgi:ATP-dependent DNA helicase RecQ